jgi:hypothetical protein
MEGDLSFGKVLQSAMRTRALRCAIRGRGDIEELREQLLRLALPAPDIVEAVLAGGAGQSVMLESVKRSLPASCEEQHARIAEPQIS